MTKEQIIAEIVAKQSMLCVGLDTDRKKVPQFLIEKYPETWMFEFNRRIIDATAPYCIAYKPNLAFYEAEGVAGFVSLEKTAWYIKETYPSMFLIVDAKRADIGNTSEMYAKAWLMNLPFDAITVAPYMGEDSVKPFLLPNKWVILLALTSNKGSEDFQMLNCKNNPKLSQDYDWHKVWELVMRKSQSWATNEQMMYVVGATNGTLMRNARMEAPNHIFLIPGVGAQGATVEDVFENCITKDGLGIINSSRGIIYVSNGEDFADAAEKAARTEQQKMAHLMELKGII